MSEHGHVITGDLARPCDPLSSIRPAERESQAWTWGLYLGMGAGLAMALSVIAGGCGGATPSQSTGYDFDEPDDAEPALPEQVVSPDPVPGPAARSLRHAQVDRAQLDAMLDAGPGRFLRGVEVAPKFFRRAFAGWEIVQFMPGETRFAPYDVRPGDVLLTVNGARIERPQHLYELWTALRAADAVVIQLERGGQPFEIRFDVVSAAPARGTLAP